MTITANKQVEFNGLLLTGAFEIQSIEGLADLPAMRTSDVTIAGRDGIRDGTDRLGARTVTVATAIHSPSEAAFYTAVAAFKAAFMPLRTGTLPLTFRLDGIAEGNVARLNCRPRALSLPMISDYWNGVAEASVQLVANDPKLYSDLLNSQTTTLPSAGGGRTYPRTYPRIYGAVATGGSIFATNEGTWATDVLFRIDGPATNPRIENVTTGQTIELDYVLDVGEFMLVDTAARSVLLGGTASRYSSLTDTSEWFDLQPGLNQINFRAVTATAATLTAAWRSAWL